MKTVAILFVSLFILAAKAEKDADATRLNQLVDDAVKEKSSELRNIALPDKEVMFKLPVTNAEAGAQLRDGVIIGLEDLHRSDESTVRHLEDHIELSVHVGVNDVRVYMKANLYYKKPLYNVHINGALERMVLNVGLRKEGNELKVKFVRVTEFKDFSLTIDAPGFIVDTFVNTALRSTRFVYEPLVKSAIESRVRKIVEEEIKQKYSGNTDA